MKRRGFISAIGGSLLAPCLASAQPARKKPRIGYLTPTRRDTSTALISPFIEGLRKRGYVDGQNFMLDLRTAEDDVQRLPELALQLVEAKADLIVAVSPLAIVAAGRATKTIPIVMAFWGGEGLLESGLVASFSRPGGNVTGIYMLAAELEGKRLEILLQALPGARRIAVLSRVREEALLSELKQAAAAAQVELLMTDVPGENGYNSVFDAMARDRVDAVFVPSFPRFALEYRQIIDAAARHRVPAMYEWGYMARAGGLMSYGSVIDDLEDRVAEYVVRILKGASPATLPVEQPSKFELVVNLKTAKSLGLAIPQSLLLRADEVIE